MSTEESAPFKAPLVAHVILRLATGGLENGLVNLINRIPADRYRHAIICITDSTDFVERIERQDVPIIELNKNPGKDPSVYLRMWSALRKLRPDIVHTRNANAIEFQLVAALAGVRYRVHGEHGWDLHDLDGTSRKYRMIRKILSPLVSQFIAVSQDLERYLLNSVKIPAARVVQIYNGVDFMRFRQRAQEDCTLPWPGSLKGDPVVIGTVGRMQSVKNPLLLVRAFLRILELEPNLRRRLRLIMVGEGPLRNEIETVLQEHGISDLAWLPGTREDVAALMAKIDVFVLPSINEGISNTVLEAMALGVPVVATRVGGTPEIVRHGKTGTLVSLDDIDEMAAAIIRYVTDSDLRRAHGEAAKQVIERQFSLDLMVRRYLEIYDKLVGHSYPGEQEAAT